MTRIGLKQACLLSPILFNVYIDDIVDFFKEKSTPEIVIGVSKICMLLFADNIALIALSGKDMQEAKHLVQN